MIPGSPGGAGRALALGLALAVRAAAGAQAADEAPIACAPTEAGAGRVAQIVSALELKLDDGARVRLAELAVPTPRANAPSRRTPSAGGDSDAIDDPAQDIVSETVPGRLALIALERRALGRQVLLYFDGAQSDRHGRALAQVLIAGADEPWLQHALIAEGAALVDSWAGNRACAAELLAVEAEAREARRGLWADPSNRVLITSEADLGEGRFAILEGLVVEATKLRSPARVYLNFGSDWRTDFTVRIEPAAVRLFERDGIDPLSLRGARIRVRGYVGWRAGPEIEATHPEVIEIIEKAGDRTPD